MKICIPTLVYKRPTVFKAYAIGVKNLIKTFPEIEFSIVCVGSCKEDREMVEREGFKYFDYSNNNLGDKAQFRLERARDENPDACVFLGSDDIILPAAFGYVIRQFEKGYDYVASYDIYYIFNKMLYYSAGYPEGHGRHMHPMAVGRLLSKKVLDDVNWNLWKSAPKGLDGIANRKLDLIEKKHYYYLKDIGSKVIDIKKEDNLTKFNKLNILRPCKTKDYLDNEIMQCL